LTVNDNPAGGVGAHVSGRSAGDMLGTGDTPDFAEDSAIDYILGLHCEAHCHHQSCGERGAEEEEDRAETVELVHVPEGTIVQVPTVVQMEVLHMVKTVIPFVATENATQRRSITSSASCM